MRFTPKTPEELSPVFPKGEYPGEVKTAEDAVSKKGNDMIKLGVKVWAPDGNSSTMITDYLMESMAHKLRHFCEATGMMDLYESGDLTAEDCLDRNVRVKLKIEKQDGYPDKNAIADYVVPKPPAPENVAQPAIEKYPINRKAPYPDPNAMAAEAAVADDDGIPF